MASELTENGYPAQLSLIPVKSPVRASVIIPGSKSITNRALLIASLAKGNTLLGNPLRSDDTEHMTSALRALGVAIENTPEGYLRIAGRGGTFDEPAEPLYIGNSGTTVRFLSASCAYLPEGASCVLDGNPRMRQRPLSDLIAALAPLGAHVESLNATGCPPVRAHGGGLRGGETTISGSISSQYLSALMMAAPGARSDVAVHIHGDLVSRPYAQMTTAVMRAFGAAAPDIDGDTLTIGAGQIYHGRNYLVEPDASNASYFLAAAAITGGEITIQGLGSNSIQGDIGFVGALEQCGASVDIAPNTIVLRGPAKIEPVEIDMTLTPDVAQTLAVVCLFAAGKSIIRGLQTLKVKETDRIEAVATELRKLGAEVESGADYWVITPPRQIKRETTIRTYDDHRMAMAFAVAGLRTPVTIDDPGCVAKTFPSFWTQWDRAFYDIAGEDDEQH